MALTIAWVIACRSRRPAIRIPSVVSVIVWHTPPLTYKSVITIRGIMSKSHSYHFIFKKGTEYKDLVPAFPDILGIILKENDHFQGNEASDEENREMFELLNIQDLQENRKPEGYNRKGKYRLMFPLDRVEVYIKSTVAKPADIKRVAEKVKEILSASGLEFTTSEDDGIELA